jgi:diguanylate cyclase (GGDEF)-like protein
MGGDEFALIIPEMTPEKLLPMAIRIRQKIQANRVTGSRGEVVGVTASIGLACSIPSDEPVEMEEHLRRADEALLQAKKEGGNRIILYGHDSQ